MRWLTTSVISLFFLRIIIGEAYFLRPVIIFESVVLMIGFILFFYLGISSIYQKKPLPDSSLTIPEIIFIFFMISLIISSFLSIDKNQSISACMHFTCLYIWYWIVKNIPWTTQVRKLLRLTVIAGTFLLVAYAFYQYNFGFEAMRKFLEANPQHIIDSDEFIKRVNANTVFASFMYPPAFGNYLTMVFFIMLGICISKGNPFRPEFDLALFIQYLILISIIPTIILTKAKGAQLCLIIGGIIFGLIVKKNNREKYFLIFLILLVLFFSCFYFIGISEKVHLPGFNNILKSLNVRFEYWKAAGKMISQRPIFGFGPGTFGDAYSQYKTLKAEETVMAHNSYLQIWAESGILSFILFCLFITVFIKTQLDKIKSLNGKYRYIPAGLITAIISFFILNLVDFSLYDGHLAFIAFGFVGWLENINQNQTIVKCEKNNSQKTKKFATMLTAFALVTILLAYNSAVYLASFNDVKASEYFKAEDYNTALAYAQKAADFNPLSAIYLIRRGIIYETIAYIYNNKKENYLKNAIISYEKAVALNQYVAYYHYRLGAALFRLEDKKSKIRALSELKKAIDCYPVNPFYHEQLSHAYDIMGQYEKAEKYKQKAEELKKHFKKGTR
jgi:O-antigen ligase